MLILGKPLLWKYEIQQDRTLLKTHIHGVHEKMKIQVIHSVKIFIKLKVKEIPRWIFLNYLRSEVPHFYI